LAEEEKIEANPAWQARFRVKSNLASREWLCEMRHASIAAVQPNGCPLMSEWRILITDGLSECGLAVLRSAATVEDLTGISAQGLIEAMAGCHALIVRGRSQVTREVLAAAPLLRVVGRAGVGVDNIDLQAASDQGVMVVNAPQSTTVSVAEHTLALLLALARSISQADAAMKAGRWDKKEMEGIELSGKVLGVIGMGYIGSALAQRAVALGMIVVGYDPLIAAEVILQRGAEPLSLGELYARSDFISLHVPLSPQTAGMIDAAALQQMKPGVRLVCTSRGGLVDEAALLAALQAGKVAGAALDVFAQEPPGESPLVAHPRVIATPHIAAQTAEAQARAGLDIAQEVLAALRGEPLRWRVV
jgi:D-3-phosphoglycerate dehydrogenase